MTFLTLACALLGASILALVAAQGLLSLSDRAGLLLSLALAAGYAVLLWGRPDAAGLANFAVVLGGVSVGFLLSLILPSAESVLAFLVTAAIVDLLSFSDGLTHQILEAYRTGGSTLLRFLAVFWEIGGRTYAVVGVGDLALLSAAYLGFRRTTGAGWAPGIWLVVGLLAAYLVGFVFAGAPGIPFLAAGGCIFLLLHRRRPTGGGEAAPG